MNLLTAMGLMSGTSMDGIDVAIIKTDGDYSIEPIAYDSLSYTPEFKFLLKAVEFSVRAEQGNLLQAEQNFQRHFAEFILQQGQLTAEVVMRKLMDCKRYLNSNDLTFTKIIDHSTFLHLQAINKILIKSKLKNYAIDVIGYHGQTLYHAPQHKITVQVGDADYLAQKLTTSVVNDFRSNDLHHGGQGAPLAPLYHQALAVRDSKIPLAVVNCGGIANISLITGLFV